jgi:DNA mismatch repair protein MutL
MEALRGQRQPLLHPFTIDCLPDELRSILERRTELLESGFLIEEFGPRSYIVREVPGYLEPGGEQEVMVHLIHRILEGEIGVRLYDEYAAMKACKASIKRNDYVSGPVLSDILQELAACENPSRCPHGRPTMIKITPDELDRLFYRA